ncbi:MAG: hypothetical protein HQ564_02785 [Candidatus Saganbacteria bacterium]|nr:hypothetical protein [Candidatus Saganbacteria bacterium]
MTAPQVNRRVYSVKSLYSMPARIPLRFDPTTPEGKSQITKAFNIKSSPPIIGQQDVEKLLRNIVVGNELDLEKVTLLDRSSAMVLFFMGIRGEDKKDLDSLIAIFLGRIGEQEAVLVS